MSDKIEKTVELFDAEEPFDVRTAIEQNPLARELMNQVTQFQERDGKLRKSEQSKRSTIWDMGVEEMTRKRTSIDDVTTVYFLGSEQGGKTSLLNLFLEKEQMPLERTMALDFSFARRLNSQMEKDVCHFWELGGDPREWTKLIDIPIAECHRLNRLAIFIVLDLSEPKSIWPVFETVLFNIKSGFKQTLAGLKKSTAVEIAEQLETKMTQRLTKVIKEDRKFLEPLHLPVVIIGTKYDLFENLEPETVKTVCRILRLASHLTGSTLLFYSKEDATLKRRFRELVSHYAFGTTFPKETCYENHQPIFIPHGGDTFEQIWASQSPAQSNLDFCRHHSESKFGKDKDKCHEKTVNHSLDQRFTEPDIDRRRAECLAEIALERNQIGRF